MSSNQSLTRPTRVLALIVCLTAAGGSAWAISLVSVNDEIEIGRQAQAQVRSEVPELRDRATNDYISDLGRRLAARASGPRYPYSFSVANYREINAFALPGGPVWVHRGAIDAAQTESQFAGVLAHEIAHIANRHAADQLTKMMIANLGLGLLHAVLGSGTGATTAQIAAQFIATGTFLKFSRDDEREADRAGADIMQRAGYDPAGMIEFLEVLREKARRDPGDVEVFFSTHPSPQNRIELLQTHVRSRGGRRDHPRFHDIKQHMRGLGSAQSMPRR